MRLPVIDFLVGPIDEHATDRILVVQSGSPRLFARAMARLRERYFRSQFTVLMQKGETHLLAREEGVEYLLNPGPSPAFVRSLQKRAFERIFVLYSNEPGYWKLKLLPFMLNPRGVFAINENLDWFRLDLRHSENLAAHLRWRMESSVTFAGGVGGGALEAAVKTLLYPATLGLLVVSEQVRSRRAKREGAEDWKGTNR